MSFTFKQFTIKHQACAMKVGTDSIMLGSWAQTKGVRRVLDVGTGSGLLAIMLAQRTSDSCQITAIDIDDAAIAQAIENGQNSPWTEKLTFCHTSLQHFALNTPSANERYDLIVSNPPYFRVNFTANSLQANQRRINARQTAELDHFTLLEKVAQLLSDTGKFYCVLPTEAVSAFVKLAGSQNLFCIRELQVRTKYQGNITRHLLAFSQVDQPNAREAINVYNEQGSYSSEYIALCKSYYLNF